MCGISGVFAFNESGKSFLNYLPVANETLNKRGPDNGATFINENIGLGHRRLSIIDLSVEANQPMFDSTGKYAIIFNGEIFNYKILREELIAGGVQFRTASDTEVLLELYKKYGENFLHRLNGFFSFAISDIAEQKMFIVRDRYGVKPLWYFKTGDVLLFASELKALLKFPFERKIDRDALMIYLQLNYIPGPISILKGVSKLLPGYSISIQNNEMKISKYYEIPSSIIDVTKIDNYDKSKKILYTLMDEAVERRLISDVPLGSFLSGGIDSSVITALASKHTNHLNTFSIGYKDDPYFDETYYAELVAKMHKTNHTVFSLTQEDVFSELDQILDYMDEPFADSSALPVYVLSKQTRNHVKVALSGDGADELFGGYMKHWAEYRMRNMSISETAVKYLAPLWKVLPQSRNGKLTNRFRQLNRFADGASLSASERYWRWCSISSYSDAESIMNTSFHPDTKKIQHIKNDLIKYIDGGSDMNDVLLNDMNLVLPFDMLNKVDMMSMANSLEVRTPFLDYTVVEWAFRQPSIYKVDRHFRKKIVQDTFRDILPAELYNRPKKGFEVPLLNWLKVGLKEKIEKEYFNIDFINQQKIFDYNELQILWQKLQGNNPEDSAARVWAVVVFQHWWKKYFISD